MSCESEQTYKKKSLGKAPDPLFTLRHQERSPIHAVKFVTPNLLATGNQSAGLSIWDPHTRRQVATTKITTTDHSCIQILPVPDISPEGATPQGLTLLTQTRDGVIRLWDLENSLDTPVHQIQTDAYGLCRCAVSKDRMLASPTDARDRRIFLWDLSHRSAKAVSQIKEPITPRTPECMMMHCSFCGDSDQYLACSHEDGSISIWDRRKEAWLVSGC